MSQLEVIGPDVADLKDAVQRATDLLSQTMGMVQTTLRAMIEAGVKLIRAKGELDHGEWSKWLEQQLPDLSRETARRWMRLAEFAHRYGAELEKASTVTQAYKLAGLLPESEGGGGSKEIESDYVRLVRDVTKLRERLASIKDWSPSDITRFKEELRPLVEIYQQLI